MFYLLTQDQNNDLGWHTYNYPATDEAEAGERAGEDYDTGEYRDGIFLTEKQRRWLVKQASAR